MLLVVLHTRCEASLDVLKGVEVYPKIILFFVVGEYVDIITYCSCTYFVFTLED
jgi:hypothetical protein